MASPGEQKTKIPLVIVLQECYDFNDLATDKGSWGDPAEKELELF